MPKRITNEEFINRMRNINSNILIQSKYLGSHSYIRCKCLIDGFEWDALATNLLCGKGCPKCSINKHQRTNDEYINELKYINPYVKPLEKYIKNDIPIKHQCLIDGYIFITKPSTILSGHGCPKCAGNNHKTNNEYVEELHNIHPNILPLENYINSSTKIRHKCSIHNYEWDVCPNELLNGSNCPVCSGILMTHDIYVERVNKINSNIEVIERYINSLTPIKHRCKIDGYVWKTTPNCILSGTGCPKCYGNIKKTTEQFVDELSKINQNIIVLGNYNGANKKIKCKCKLDGCIWYPTPSNLLHPFGCPVCKSSKGEKKCSEWFDLHNITYISQYTFDDLRYKKNSLLKFDFAILDVNNNLHCLIEYDGEQHFEPIDYAGKGEEWAEEQLKLNIIRDNIKDKYCFNNNIKLIRISYLNYDDIESILESELIQ